MTKLAVIGGSGLARLEGMNITRHERVETPYGEPSSPLVYGELEGVEVVFLPRHGGGHTIPPHQINYRANIFALHQAGVEDVIAIAAVGGIREDMGPGVIAVPDQIIDYTWGRKHTFFEDGLDAVTHVDFTRPYCETLRRDLLAIAREQGIPVAEEGVYGATQGPRLESGAEIDRMQRDGCTLVGMTGMPEASLAREIGLCYASCAVVANRAAGRGEGEISMAEIESTLEKTMGQIKILLSSFLKNMNKLD